MKTIGAFFTLAYVLGPILAIPVDLNDEVEFVEPVNTNADSPVISEGIPAQIPILVIRTGNPFFGSFGGSGFPGLRPKSQDEPSANGAGSFLGFEDIFNSFFGPSPSNTEADYDGDFDDTVNLRPLDEAIPTSGTPQCGLICQIMNQFQGQIATIEKEIHDIREKEQERENEIEVDRVDGQDDQDNEPQHTYEEKILPDGSVVRINRTVLTDRNGDGSAFIFHSTSFHNILSPEDHADEGPFADGDNSSANNDEATDFEDVDPKEDEEPSFEYPEADIPDLKDVQEADEARSKRSAQFGQQVESSFKPKFFQKAPSKSQSSQNGNLILADPYDNNPAPNLATDTRVNEIIMEDARRGGLIRIDPDSELIEENEFGQVVPIQFGQAPVQADDSPWEQQQTVRVFQS